MNSPTGRVIHRMPSEQYLKQSIAAQDQVNHLKKAIVEAGGKIEGDVVDWSSTDYSELERRASARLLRDKNEN